MKWSGVVLLYFLMLNGHAQEVPNQQPYILKSIYFDGGSFLVDDDQMQPIVELLDSIPDLIDYTIAIHSHTDNIGGAAYNEWLSQMRSEAVIEKAVQQYFEKERTPFIERFKLSDPASGR